MALQPSADFRHFNGHLPVSSVLWPLFPVFHFASIVSVCTLFHQLFLVVVIDESYFTLLLLLLLTWSLFL